MGTIYLSLMLLLMMTNQLQVDGQITSPAKERFLQVGIESIDRRFVEYGDIDVSGRFTFKKIPEGLYKLTIVAVGGRAEQRTIEVRSEFANKHGQVPIKIELNEAS